MLIGSFFTFAIVTFDFKPSIRNFIQQRWAEGEMRRARKISCQAGTADTLCTVPILGYPYASQVSKVVYIFYLSAKQAYVITSDSTLIQDEWCWIIYQSTECASIQAEALDFFNGRISTIMNWIGVLLIFLVVDMAVEMFISVRLVAVPIIMLSMQAMASYLLILPAAVSKLGLLLRARTSSSYFSLIILPPPPRDKMFGALAQ